MQPEFFSSVLRSIACCFLLTTLACAPSFIAGLQHKTDPLLGFVTLLVAGALVGACIWRGAVVLPREFKEPGQVCYLKEKAETLSAAHSTPKLVQLSQQKSAPAISLNILRVLFAVVGVVCTLMATPFIFIGTLLLMAETSRLAGCSLLLVALLPSVLAVFSWWVFIVSFRTGKPTT
jgi:hypothetical protein